MKRWRTEKGLQAVAYVSLHLINVGGTAWGTLRLMILEMLWTLGLITGFIGWSMSKWECHITWLLLGYIGSIQI